MLMVAGYICTCFLSQKDNLRQENSGFFSSHLQGHSTVFCATKQVPSAGLSSKVEQVRLYLRRFCIIPWILFSCQSWRRHILELTSLHALFPAERLVFNFSDLLEEVVFPVFQQLDFCLWVPNAWWILAQLTTFSQSWTSSSSSLLLPKISSHRHCCPFLLILPVFMSSQWKAIGMQPS